MFATRGGEVRIYDTSLAVGKEAATYVEQNIDRVAATVEGGRPGRATVTDNLPHALSGAWLAVEPVPSG
ncbi:hypothetical protein ACIODW_00010 [Streptomyces sp. NPDC087897]|uniref:hypothetical protein n=1 Tax=Streptomyces sp. NPDC087897 TaxID=3365817 RepID=UPI0037F3751B